MNDTYIVMIVTLVIWLGVFLYLIGLDRKVSRLTKEVERNEQ